MAAAHRIRLAVLALVVAGFVGGAPSAAQKLPDGAVRTVRCPHEGIQPRVVQNQQGLHLIFFKGEIEAGDLFYARSGDYGETFSEPIRVNSVDGSVDASGWTRGASLALGRDDRVHVAWTGSEAAAEHGPEGEALLLYARLDDAGSSFEDERNLIQERYGLRTVPAIAADPDGRVHVFWHAPDDDADGPRRVWKVSSTDDGETFSAEVAIDRDTGATEEAGLTALAGKDGKLVVLYQAREQRARDLVLMPSRDGGETFGSRLVVGLQMQREPKSTLFLGRGATHALAAWEENGRVLCAFVKRNNRGFELPLEPRFNKSYRRRPAVTASAHEAVVLAWMEAPNPRKPVERLAWQGFSTRTRTNIGQGRVKDVSRHTSPAIFLRRDQGFTILY